MCKYVLYKQTIAQTLKDCLKTARAQYTRVGASITSKIVVIDNALLKNFQL